MNAQERAEWEAIEAELRERFGKMSRQELLDRVKAMKGLEQRMMVAGPQTDDELHAFIKEQLSIDIPRVAVCPDHCAPFDFVADVYFYRTLRAIGMACRGGMKTLGMAVVGYLRERFTAGVEAAHVGAVEMQARRAYNHFTRLLDMPTSEGLVDPRNRTMGETRWKNGSRVEILAGTINAVNGPHPQFTHADEVELMDPVVYSESLSMPKTGRNASGVEIPAQYVITSTRKRAHGMMQRIWAECVEAEKKGFLPPYKRYAWCVTGDTLIDCPRDHRRFPDGVPISMVKPGQLVWSFNEGDKRFELKRIKHVQVTRRDAPIVKLALDSGDVIRLTADHEVLTRKMEWKPAGQLQPGESLMAMHRDFEPMVRAKPLMPDGGGKLREFDAMVLATGGRISGIHVHHVDGWRANTSEDNLVRLTASEHQSLEWHSLKRAGLNGGLGNNAARKESLEQHWRSLSVEEKLERIAALKEGAARARTRKRERRCKLCNSTFVGVQNQKYCGGCREFEDTCPGCGETFTNSRIPNVYRETCSRSCTWKVRALTGEEAYNHKVIAVEPDGCEDVWDMEVEGNHNFVVHGVVLHNCAFECAKQVPNCRSAPENAGRPDEELCECNRIVNGVWPDGRDRTLESVCRGRFFRSRGFMPYSDIMSDFTTIPQRQWEAQMECIRPSTEGLVLPQCTREACGVHYEFDPAKGPLISVWDPGGPNPHAVGWYQELRYEARALDMAGREVTMPIGSIVLIDEIYRAGIGNTKCADLVCQREDAYRAKHRNSFRVALRICDPHTSARLDWIQHDPPLQCTFLGTHNVKEQVKVVNDFVDDKQFYADLKCENFWTEVEQWHYPDPKRDLLDDPERPVEDCDHMMATLRYGCQAFHVIRRRRRPDASVGPVVDGSMSYEEMRRKVGPLASGGDPRDPRRTEGWRSSFAPAGRS